MTSLWATLGYLRKMSNPIIRRPMDNPVKSSLQSTTVSLKAGRRMDLQIFQGSSTGTSRSGPWCWVPIFHIQKRQWHRLEGEKSNVQASCSSPLPQGTWTAVTRTETKWAWKTVFLFEHYIPSPFSLFSSQNWKRKHCNSWGLLKETNNEILWNHRRVPKYNTMKTARLIQEMGNKNI